MVRQILLQVIFVVYLQDVPHFIHRDLWQFHLAHQGVGQTDSHRYILCRAAQRLGDGMKMIPQLFG